MQPFAKRKIVVVLVVSGLILSVFMLVVTPNTIANVSAIEAAGVGVYWDSNCSEGVSSINWGNLAPGSVKSIVVFIRNEVAEQAYLVLWTENWNPSEASHYLTLACHQSGQRMNPNETLQIALTLSVFWNIEGISSFSFDIIITASDSLPGDVNGDGIVNVQDALAAAIAFGSQPGDPNWNARADMNNDGIISGLDIDIIGANFGKTV